MSKLNIDQKSVKALFSEKKADFLIPDYQRPYAWGEKECQTLWDDLFLFAFPDNDCDKFKSDSDEYFLGPIVTFKNDDGKLEIIDGQQRLTTFALQEKTSFPPLLMDTALVYSKGSSTVTQKKAPNNICFNDLDVTLSSLIELIYCEQKNNPFSFMNFVPEDDKGLGRVTNDMVKGIVTCLECEIARLKKSDDITSAIQDNKNDTYIQEELRLQSLVKELQKVAKDFQKKNGKFSKKTNDMICGRLKYMTIADADKVCLFYVKYQKFIRKLFDKFEIVPTEDDIQNLIIYRNRTTHGTQAVLDEHIVTTALYLTGLIYCMILHSIGIDDKNLEQLCSRHFLWR